MIFAVLSGGDWLSDWSGKPLGSEQWIVQRRTYWQILGSTSAGVGLAPTRMICRR